MAGSAGFGTLAHGWQNSDAIWYVVILFAAGGMLSGAMCWQGAAWKPFRTSRHRFWLFPALLTIITIGGTACLFALQYRLYYAQWHFDFPSIGWFFQLAFTSAAAVYLFAGSGIRLLWPFGFAAICCAGLAYWRFSRHPAH
ncbi:MAG: hypothetical protein AAF468_05220 [Pseudomonadota bacterium]